MRSRGLLCNENGKNWYELVSQNHHVKLVGNSEITDVKGGRIDYACIFGNLCFAECNVSDELHSDNFAVVIDCSFQEVDSNIGRKRLNLDPKFKKKEILKDLNKWYKEFQGKSENNDVDSFCGALVSQIQSLLRSDGKVTVKSKRTQMKEIKRWYNSDPVLKRISREMNNV